MAHHAVFANFLRESEKTRQKTGNSSGYLLTTQCFYKIFLREAFPCPALPHGPAPAAKIPAPIMKRLIYRIFTDDLVHPEPAAASMSQGESVRASVIPMVFRFDPLWASRPTRSGLT